MTANLVSRRAALAGLFLPPLLLSACGGGPRPPVKYAPLNWDYLPRLKLNVAVVDIDDSWTPRAVALEKGFLAPTPPVDALRKMAEDRLIAGGTSGRALFVIDDASIVQSRATYVGSFAVHLDISTSDGTHSGFAEAKATRQRSIGDDSLEGVRAELYDMVGQMMADMNIEFEFQVRRSLRDYLQTTAPAASVPAPVDQQQLESPPPPTVLVPSPPPEVPSSPDAPPRPSAVPFSTPDPAPLLRR